MLSGATNALDLVAGARVERRFMEFVVDGERLGRVLGPFLGLTDVTADLVPVLVTNWPGAAVPAELDLLLGLGSTAELGGRTALYTCAECGDLGCGGVTAVVEVGERQVVWREFGYQNDYEPFDPDEVFAAVGPFVFGRREYSAVLEGFRVIALRAGRG